MQRVALGRAIVRDTDIFLMDEPLSNLDAKLRTTMREELVQLHRKLNATTIFVTHDQTEAMTMGDKIVVLNEGKVQQVGSPSEIYHHPANLFVANFIGSPAMNLLTLEKQSHGYALMGRPVMTPAFTKRPDEIILGIRPEDCKVLEGDGIPLKITFIEDMGADQYIHGIVAGQKMVVRESPSTRYEIGQEIFITIPPDKISWFDKQTGERLKINEQGYNYEQLRVKHG